MAVSRSLLSKSSEILSSRRSYAVISPARSIEISQQIRIALWLDKIELAGLFIRRVDTRWQTFRFDAPPLYAEPEVRPSDIHLPPDRFHRLDSS